MEFSDNLYFIFYTEKILPIATLNKNIDNNIYSALPTNMSYPYKLNTAKCACTLNFGSRFHVASK